MTYMFLENKNENQQERGQSAGEFAQIIIR